MEQNNTFSLFQIFIIITNLFFVFVGSISLHTLWRILFFFSVFYSITKVANKQKNMGQIHQSHIITVMPVIFELYFIVFKVLSHKFSHFTKFLEVCTVQNSWRHVWCLALRSFVLIGSWSIGWLVMDSNSIGISSQSPTLAMPWWPFARNSRPFY